MRKFPLIAAGLVLAVFSHWMNRELDRGTFDAVERRYAGWLAANTAAETALPPLVVVLYDEAASDLAGVPRMAVLDGALFARAAARLGAVAAGVEGLPGNPSRMIEAAGRMPVFGGFSLSSPPGNGWTPCAGSPGAGWTELPGLAGPAAVRFPRGVFLPPSGGAGPRSVVLVARNSDRPVPSFLAMVWAAGLGLRPSSLAAVPGRLEGGGRFLPLDANGSAGFFAEDGPKIMGLNEFLVAAEKFEREGGVSPLQGCICVLSRATPDVERVRGADSVEALTPAQLWAQSWEALRRGRAFVLPGPWYPLLVALAGLALGAGAGRGGRVSLSLAGTAALFAFLLIALGAFATYGLLLPLVPSATTLLAGLFSARLWMRGEGAEAP